MIYVGTLLKVIDNTGAKIARCVKLYRGSIRYGALIGDQILISVRQIIFSKKLLKVKKSSLYRAVIVRTVKELCRKDGTVASMDSNSVVLIQANGLPLGTRVKGPIFKEIRDFQFLKVAAISEGIV